LTYDVKTTTTLHFILTELGKDLKFQDELYSDILKYYDPRTETLNSDHLEKMDLVRAVIKEGMRLDFFEVKKTLYVS
jgi:hypothetical protein